ncbi:MAG: FAD-binding oxidoreductase, partial [Gemmatimonadota bacterium]
MEFPANLREIIRDDARARAAYSEGAGIYRIVPAAVCTPRNVAELSQLLRWAFESGTALIFRGAGSAMGGGNVGSGVVVDLAALAPRVLAIDPVGRTARTSANVTLAELNDAASASGLRLPPDPSSANWATVGGMVSTNAAGPRTLRYGSIRPWVRALEVVTTSGDHGWIRRRAEAVPGEPGMSDAALLELEARLTSEIHPFASLISASFPRTRKNSSGYALDAFVESGDLVDLLIGSEGTLAAIITVDWRLDPIPAEHAALRISLRSLDDLGDAVPALARLGPSAIELLDRTFLELVRTSSRSVELPAWPTDTQAMLLVEFEGENTGSVRGLVGDAVRAVEPWAAEVETALTADEERRLWALRHAASPILVGLPETRRSMQVIEDGCVPLSRLAEYIGFIRRAADTRGLSVVIFGHAGDGNVHVNLLPELARVDWQTQVAGLMDEVMAEVIRLGGTVTGEHGDGRLRAGLLEAQYGAEVVTLFRKVKTAFDPNGILNPGVLLDPDAPAIARLKTGTGAAPIPGDIARALRDIERTGGYARVRMEVADEVAG